jgi:BSD domain
MSSADPPAPAIEQTQPAPTTTQPRTASLPPADENPVGTYLSTWLSAVSAAATNVTSSVAPPQPDASGATAQAPQWMTEAGRMWNSAVRDVGGRLEAVRLDETVGAFRDTSSLFIDDVTKNLSTAIGDPEMLRERTAQIEMSAKGLLASASEQFQTRKKEALELFVDAPSASAGTAAGSDRRHPADEQAGLAPWDEATLPESERKYANALRAAMLKLVVDAIFSKKKRTTLFLSASAATASFSYDADANAAAAIGALEADPNLRRLRVGLVPQKISERLFWDEYFYHVRRLRTALVANAGVIPPVDDDDEDDALFGDDDNDDAEVLANINSPRVRPQRMEPEAEYSSTIPLPRKSSVSSPDVAATAAAVSAVDAATAEPNSMGHGAPAAVVGRDWENEIDALFKDDDK